MIVEKADTGSHRHLAPLAHGNVYIQQIPLVPAADPIHLNITHRRGHPLADRLAVLVEIYAHPRDRAKTVEDLLIGFEPRTLSDHDQPARAGVREPRHTGIGGVLPVMIGLGGAEDRPE